VYYPYYIDSEGTTKELVAQMKIGLDHKEFVAFDLAKCEAFKVIYLKIFWE